MSTRDVQHCQSTKDTKIETRATPIPTQTQRDGKWDFDETDKEKPHRTRSHATPRETVICEALESRDYRQGRTPPRLADICQLDLQFVSCIVTGNGVVSHRHGRVFCGREPHRRQDSEAHRSHRELLCSCLPENASRALRPSAFLADAPQRCTAPQTGHRKNRCRKGSLQHISLVQVLPKSALYWWAPENMNMREDRVDKRSGCGTG